MSMQSWSDSSKTRARGPRLSGGRLLAALGMCVVAVAGAGACTTSHSARPLEPGQNAVAVTLGGPIANIPNIGPIPFPHMTLEGKHGLVRNLDVNYGVHLLPLLFGVAGAHVGGTWLMLEQEGARPALALGQRVYGFSNRIDNRPEKSGRFAEWLLSQSEVTASWLVYDQLVYTGAALYVPLLTPDPKLAPFVGVELKPGLDWLRLQVEARYLAPYINTQYGVVNWVAPGNQGSVAVNFGFSVVWGDTPSASRAAGAPAGDTDNTEDADDAASLADTAAPEEAQP